jgi:C4-dicarboxylate-specific signal transduction histidine kinase
MSRNRLILSATAALIVTLGIGFAWGASGRFTIQNALDDIRQQLDLAQARGAILEARVSLYNVNFGDASRHFDEAKAPLRRARQRYQEIGKNAAAGSISAALAHVEEAQRLAGRLDQAANAKANEALEAIRVATSQ